MSREALTTPFMSFVNSGHYSFKHRTREYMSCWHCKSESRMCASGNGIGALLENETVTLPRRYRFGYSLSVSTTMLLQLICSLVLLYLLSCLTNVISTTSTNTSSATTGALDVDLFFWH
ncbi:hypothetical protein BT96DRAFT_578065 [Gymnopus androsaceus JB14]|uniref:Uncharacterized protein n=1 Tax=Gymnopus androsaceus JB14 TaxID=1447944 RepID=A0A6A4HRX1_9AGAR|nr:hypothetical protein BT96DRAFT_578065 [Gymnopus androsaceus JB14]